jgi:hypothetical protein
VDGGGIDGGDGTHFVNYGDDVHAYGSLDPLVPGHIGCIVIRPDGSRYLARAVLDRWRNSVSDGRPVLLGRASVRVPHQLLHV